MTRALRQRLCATDIQAILDKVVYARQPTWSLRFVWRDMKEMDSEDRAAPIFYLQVECKPPAAPGQWVEGERWTGRKWLLSGFMTPTEIVSTAFKAFLAAEEHELREAFLYKGRAVFGPHYDVEAMIELQDQGRVDVRPDAMQGA